LLTLSIGEHGAAIPVSECPAPSDVLRFCVGKGKDFREFFTDLAIGIADFFQYGTIFNEKPLAG
jgi:hypothetical protein